MVPSKTLSLIGVQDATRIFIIIEPPVHRVDIGQETQDRSIRDMDPPQSRVVALETLLEREFSRSQSILAFVA